MTGLNASSSPQRVILVGLMGAGKTTVGAALARKLKWSFVDSDHEIERRTGVDIPAIFEIEGEVGFRKREAQVLADLLVQDQNAVIATGGGIVLAPENRQRLRQEDCVVYLDVPPDLLWERTRFSRNRPLLKVPDPRARLRELYEQRDPLYREVAGLIIDGRATHARQVVHLLANRFLNPCEP